MNSIQKCGFVSIVVLCSQAADVSLAFANMSWCGRAYRRDSYGLGIESGFKGQTFRPKLIDEGCYRLGIQVGLQLKDGAEPNCESEFDRGRQKGLLGEIGLLADGCFDSGVIAGYSALHVGAREGLTDLVSLACVSEYKRGKRDAELKLVSRPPVERPANECYRTGYFDGQMLPDIGN